MTLPMYLRMASMGGIPPRDALLLLTPGEVFDAFTLGCSQHGIDRRDE